MTEVTSVLVCYPRHIRQASLCMKGSRYWCEQNGVDWNDFVSYGIESDRLLASGDPIVLRVVEAARKEAERG